VAGFLAFLVSPLWVSAVVDVSRSVRGRSSLTRDDVVAKYRFLALFCLVLAGYFAIAFVVPPLFFRRGSLWNLVGVPAAFLFLARVPKPMAPAGRMPARQAEPSTGQGVVLIRVEETVPITAFPVVVDGNAVGTVRRGQSVTIELEPGTHMIELKPSRGVRRRTPPQIVVIEPGRWSTLVCGSRREFPKLKDIFHSERRVWVHPLSNGHA